MNFRQIKTAIILTLLFKIHLVSGQVFEQTMESIHNIENKNDMPKLIGVFNNHPTFKYSNYKNDTVLIKFLQLDESKLEFMNTGVSAKANNRLSSDFLNFNEFVFHRNIIFESIEDYGHNELILFYNNKQYFLDSIYNADKKIHSSFSRDGKLLLINTLNTLGGYYNPDQDNRIMVYNLSEIDNGNIIKEQVPCHLCSDSYLIGDTIFFTIARKDAYDGYNNKDIYMAPWSNIKDTVKIASNTKIIAISPDGKYILGSRFFDRQKNTCVIIDVKSKKYQMLLGRRLL